MEGTSVQLGIKLEVGIDIFNKLKVYFPRLLKQLLDSLLDDSDMG